MRATETIFERETREGVSVSWTGADHRAASREGWFLDLEDGAFQVGNAARFSSPAAVLDHVRAAATRGSSLHIRAMLFDAAAALDAWEARHEETAAEVVTPVLFRVERNGPGRGSVTAVFPTIPADASGHLMCCYAQVGQHSGCSWSWYLKTRPATPEEYAPLAAELEAIGYRLQVARRITRQHREALRADLQQYFPRQTVA